MSQEAKTTISDKNEDDFGEDETGDSEQLVEEGLGSSSEYIGEDRDEESSRKDVGEPEDKFEGEDGEEP